MRRTTIYRIVEQEGGAKTRHLADLLGVSSITVARDIKHLHAQGMVQRVRGGAVRGGVPPTSSRRAVGEATGLIGQATLDSVAAEARAYIHDGAVIALSAGPISTLVAQAAARVPGITAVTYSLSVAQAFHRFAGDDQVLILAGGTVIRWHTVQGAMAARNLRSMRVDVGFVEVDAVDGECGLSNVDRDAVELNRAILAAADRVVFLAERVAWSRPAGHHLTPLTDGTVLLSGAKLSESAREAVGQRRRAAGNRRRVPRGVPPLAAWKRPLGDDVMTETVDGHAET